MANLNRVMLIGRLTREPEVRTFSNGGKVAKIGFAVNNRKKNAQSDQWEDEPVFLEVEAFNRATGRKLADLTEQYLHKGDQAYIEGHLRLDQWTQQDGTKRQKLVVVMDTVEFLQGRRDGSGGGGGSDGYEGESRPAPRSAPRSAQARNEYSEPAGEMEPLDPPPGVSGDDSNIPF